MTGGNGKRTQGVVLLIAVAAGAAMPARGIWTGSVGGTRADTGVSRADTGVCPYYANVCRRWMAAGETGKTPVAAG